MNSIKSSIAVFSTLTSDNFLARAGINIDADSRLLLSLEQQEQWLLGLDKGELNPELVESEEWKKSVNKPRIKIYQTGKLDSVLLRWCPELWQVTCKVCFMGDVGHAGTSNFDYRARLFSNEFGFFQGRLDHYRFKESFCRPESQILSLG